MGGNLSEEQRETLGLIDAILSMIEKLPENEINLNLTVSPFDFLLKIISLIAPYDKMIEFLSKAITVVVPLAEVSVKALLLAKLKERIDCNSDPRIPDWIRRDVSKTATEVDTNKKGLYFNIRELDHLNMMSVCPISGYGSKIYYGTRSYFKINTEEYKDEKFPRREYAVKKCQEKGISLDNISLVSEINNIYELARAKDFNAFLWFVLNKGYFPNTIKPSDVYTISDENNILRETKVSEDLNGKEIPKINVGDAVGTSESYIYSLCINSETTQVNGKCDINNQDVMSKDIAKEQIAYNNSPRTVTHTIVPMSCDNKSLNWYVNSGTYFDFLKPKDKRNPRNYTEEYAICNLKYVDKYEGSYDNGSNFLMYDALKFTILPKPFVHIPHNGEPAWRIKRILFNEKGEADKKGKYSVVVTNKKPSVDNDSICQYDISDSNIKLVIDKSTGEYSLSNKLITNLDKVLYECYPGLTVYEFNYDFVMSMQLFDPVAITTRLLTLITDINMGGVEMNLKINKYETAYQMRIAEIVKNIVEAEAYEVSDCFYTFSNDKYDEMIRKSEMKRSNLYPFNKNGKNEATSRNDKSLDILNEFNDEATLNENIDVITRAFTQATASVTEEVLPEDRYGIQKDIITDVIRALTNIIVETLITPKIILLFEVNIALLGKRDETNFIKSIDELLDSLSNLIVAIVREIRDLILQSILDWVMSLLEELFNALKDKLVKEQLEYYSRLMKLLLKACSFKKHRKKLDSELDHVDYADIDEIDRPQEASC